MVSSLALYWTVPVLLGSRRALVGFCLLQGAVTFAIGLMAPQAWLVLSLYSALVGMSVGAFWPDRRLALTAATLCIGQMSATLVLTRGLEAFLDMLPLHRVDVGRLRLHVRDPLRPPVPGPAEAPGSFLRSLQEANRQLQAYAAKVEGAHPGPRAPADGPGAARHAGAGAGGADPADRGRRRAPGEREHGPRTRADPAGEAAGPDDAPRGPTRHSRTAPRDSGTRGSSRGTRPRGGPVRFLPRHPLRALEASVGSVDPPPETAQDVLRFVQEGLSNVARHAQATRATVRIEQGDAEAPG